MLGMRTTRRKFLLVAVVTGGVGLALVVLALVLYLNAFDNTIVHGVSAGLNPNGKGVVITSCGPDSRGDVEVRGTAHNTTARRADYVIGIDVKNRARVQVASTSAAPSRVPSGQTTQWKASTTASFTASTTCELAFVTRTSAP